MVVKVTFQDNDYTNILESIFNNFTTVLSDYTIKQLMEEILQEGKATSFDNTTDYITKLLTQGEVEKPESIVLKELITDVITKYIKEHNEEDYDYLHRHLKVTITKSLTPKWENGEVVYYIPLTDTCITL